MPQIIVTADKQTDSGQPPVMFRERVSARDFESGHFSAQLVERLGWAVEDAAEVERQEDWTEVEGGRGRSDVDAEWTDSGSEVPAEPALSSAAVRAAAPQAW